MILSSVGRFFQVITMGVLKIRYIYKYLIIIISAVMNNVPNIGLRYIINKLKLMILFYV